MICLENGYGGKKLSNTEKFYNNMISFPFHVWMSNQEFKYLINSVKNALIEIRKLCKQPKLLRIRKKFINFK